MTVQTGFEALSQTVQGWGYANVDVFAKEQAKGILQQKIAYYQSRIDFFEQKYALKFNDFCEKFSSIKNHGIIEKEDTYQPNFTNLVPDTPSLLTTQVLK